MRNILVMAGLGILVVLGYKAAKRFVLKPSIESGVKAYEISGKLPDGNSFTLSDLRGKYVLLDFWGSWCKPCRRAHPELKKLYVEYHPEKAGQTAQFEIVSFGVERSEARWREAILQDGLPWPYHLVSTALFAHPFVEAYNVRQIPTRFLIDPEGAIIAVDPSIHQIKKTLAASLGQ
jgi:thiol-disulfide isomerase/thioredoxin